MNHTLLKRKLLSTRAYACAILLSVFCLASAEAQTSNAALQFDGIDDYLSLGTTKFNGLKSVTFAAWIYRTGNSGSGFDEIVAKENIVSFAINNSNDLLRLNFGNGSSWGTSVESSSTIPMNTWTHVAGTRDVNTGIVTLYINGVEAGSGTNTSYGTNTYDAAIGHKPGVSFEDAAFEGIIDECRIWGKSLCASEVNAYNTGMISSALSQLWASLSFESGTANGDNTALTSVSDFTGNYPGTLNNFDLIGTTSNFVPGNSSISGTCTPYALTTPVITTGGGTAICSGSSLSLSTSTVASQYYWSNGQTGAVCNATASGAYTVTTYDINGCNAMSSSVSLTTSPSYTISSATYTAGTTSFCRGLSQTISVRVNYSPVGSKAYTLQLSTDSTFASVNYSTSATLTGGVGTLSFAGTAVRLWATGKYFVRVTGTCITNGSVSLTPIQVWAPVTIQATSNSPVCSGDDLTMNATDGGNTYVWAGPNGFSAYVKSVTLNSASVLAGVYTVTATNSCGTYTGTTTVVINSLPALSVNTTNATCPGATNGSIVLSSTDANAPLTFSLNNETNGGSLFNNLSAGDYNISIVNAKGCKSNQVVHLTDEDETPPTALAKNITLILDEEGNALLDPMAIDDGSSDGCGVQSITVEPSSFGLSQIGTNLVTLSVTDNNGHTTHASSIVTVLDQTAPSIEAHSSLDFALGADGTINVNPFDFVISAFDVSGIASVTLSKTSFDCQSVGSNDVTLTVTDNNGNQTGQSVKIIIVDNTAPVLLYNPITVNLDAAGKALISPLDVDNGSSDACGLESITLSQTEFTCDNLGENTLEFAVTDNHGNTASVEVIVTVTDNTAPIVTTQNLSLTLPASGTITIEANDVNAGSSDNCSIQSITVSPSTFNNTNIGANTVLLTVVDAAGNTTSAPATVTIAGTPSTFTNPTIFINSSNRVEWANIPGVSNGTSAVIGTGSTFNGNQITLTSTGGNINSSTTNGLGVTGAGTSPATCGGASYMNETVNKSQTIKATLNSTSLGITGLVFRSAYAAKVMVSGRRNGQTVISFSKYMAANDYDTFDFTTACALRGICTVDEIEFKLSDRTAGCVRRWNQYEDNENTDYEDGINVSTNCGFTINNMVLTVKEKDECNIGSISFNWNDGVFASKVVGISDNLSTGISNVHSLATNSDGVFTTGSPVTSNSAKRLVVGYNWLGLASAWEITSQCKLRTIRQGLLSNSEVLPVVNPTHLLVFEFKITSISPNGQYIYGTRRNRNNNTLVDIRWRVNEYYQRVWISNPQVIQYSKTGESEVFSDDDVVVIDEAQYEMGDLNVSIYPNPSNDVFNFKLESGSLEPFNIEVYDMMGRLIQSNTNLNAGNEAAIGQDLNPGVYLVKVTQGTQVRIAKVTRLN